jgi:transcription factor IIIB subunit 2
MFFLKLILIRGRKKEHVDAACLYSACRAKKSSHMLLDFSEALKEDVFVLGSVFVQLCRALHLDLPIAEPYFYVRRFCSYLEFGDDYNKVVKTALEFTACLDRDWIQIGRRPAGICAAAILIAARVHGFRRTQKEVTQAARICSATLSKRLKEFEATSVANMTVEEFREHAKQIQNDTYQGPECDPHIFTRNRIHKHQIEEMKKIQEQAEKDRQEYLQNEEAKREMNRIMQEEQMIQLDDEFNMEKDGNGTAEPSASGVNESEFDEQQPDAQQDEEEEIDMGDLDAIDPSEVQAFIITDPDEISKREKLWDNFNGEFMREMEKKRREKEEKAREQGDKPRRKRKRKDPNAEPEKPAQSAAESAASLRKKGIIAQRFDVENLFKFDNVDFDKGGVDYDLGTTLNEDFEEFTGIDAGVDFGEDLPDDLDDNQESENKRSRVNY